MRIISVEKIKKYRDIVSGIGFLSVIICTVLIFILVPNDFTWNWIIGGGCVYLFMAIFWSVRRSHEKYESISVSSRTLSMVNLADSFVLYLRGFKQDDYMSGGRINEKGFSEEVLSFLNSTKR